MKKIKIITLIFFIIFKGYSQTETEIRIIENNNNKLKIQLITNEITKSEIKKLNQYFTQINIKGLGSSNFVGKPQLPVYNAIINIPFCQKFETKITSLNIETTQLNQDKKYLFPSQESRSKSDTRPQTLDFDQEQYLKNEFYSPGVINIEKLGIMRNTNLATISLCPLSYNPITNEIKHIKKLEIEINFISSDITLTNELKNKYNDLFSQSVQEFTLNPFNKSTKDANSTGPLHYVIVSNFQFKTALEPFVAWKRKKGYIVTEAYTDNPNVGTTTTSIKTYLQGLYDNATTTLPAPTFVLLVGDVAQLPTFTGTSGTHPTDLYYCDYTGDYLPEAYYGRFSATTLTEVQNQVEKTIEYEKFLMPDPTFLDNVVMIAGNDNSYGPLHGDGQLNYVMNNYFVSPLTTFSYPHSVSALPATATSIINNVSNGCAMANYTAHGSTTSWAQPTFSVSDVATLHNEGKYAFMIGNACVTNKFNEPTCFGEALMRTEKKGAIGYIGGSNNTYWNEDFYYAVGYRATINLTSTYDATKLGFYDRFFHINNEPYTAWYNSMGQILQAGNMAVSMSSSTMKKYYWEIYHLMGDPSLIPYIGQPIQNTASYNPIISIGSTSFVVNTTPFSYVAITKGDTLLGADFADINGVATLNLSNTNAPSVADIVITSQNKQPYFGTINIITHSGAYVWLNTLQTSDIQGNNNQEIDFNEIISFNVNLENLGSATANNVIAKLRTNSQYITLIDTTETYGNILSGQSLSINNAFSFHVANNIPNQTSIQFELIITDNNNTWNLFINKIANAPKFEINNYTFTEITGNFNGIIEPGENIQFSINGKNIGNAAATNTIGTLNATTNGVTISNNNVNIGNVAANTNSIANYQINIPNSITSPNIAVFNYTISSGAYQNQKQLFLEIGMSSEDFETGDLTKYQWQNTSNIPWVVIDSNSFEGAYCMKSGQINNNQSSILSVTLDILCEDSITFYRKISSEANYDELNFYVNDVLLGTWSGEENWERVSFPVSPGIQTFKWEYNKDFTTIFGLDCAWIDYIIFPPINNGVGISENKNEDLNCLLYPNPTNSNLNISYYNPQNQNINIMLFDINGKLIKIIEDDKYMQKGSNLITLNTNNLQSGLYYITIQTNNSKVVKKFSVVK